MAWVAERHKSLRSGRADHENRGYIAARSCSSHRLGYLVISNELSILITAGQRVRVWGSVILFAQYGSNGWPRAWEGGDMGGWGCAVKWAWQLRCGRTIQAVWDGRSLAGPPTTHLRPTGASTRPIWNKPSGSAPRMHTLAPDTLCLAFPVHLACAFWLRVRKNVLVSKMVAPASSECPQVFQTLDWFQCHQRSSVPTCQLLKWHLMCFSF